MSILLLFLGLLPIMLLPDAFDSSDNGDGNGTGGDSGVLEPNQSDDTPPIVPIHIDPDTVLHPNDSDDTPDGFGSPVTGPVLDPTLDPDDAFSVGGDGTLLQQLLDQQSNATTGIGHLGAQITNTADTQLGAGDDTFALDSDSIDNNGEGTLGSWDGTPIIQTNGDLNVIDAGDGNDVITTGDSAAYVFGGAGDDMVTVGDGAAAVFGGAGEDVIHGSDAATYLDGGSGDDVIIGGDGHEVILGGEHGSDANVAGNDTLSGGAGDDIIRGGYGADVLSGGDGDDVLNHLGRAEELVSTEHRDFSWQIDNDADQLDGGDGNDTLIFDRADTATGGQGNDTFWLYFDADSGAGHADITDFTIGEDFLRISLNPDVASGTPDISVAPSDDGLDSVVTVNGDVVAVLQGTPSASLADVYVDIPQNIFR